MSLHISRAIMVCCSREGSTYVPLLTAAVSCIVSTLLLPPTPRKSVATSASSIPTPVSSQPRLIFISSANHRLDVSHIRTPVVQWSRSIAAGNTSYCTSCHGHFCPMYYHEQTSNVISYRLMQGGRSTGLECHQMGNGRHRHRTAKTRHAIEGDVRLSAP